MNSAPVISKPASLLNKTPVMTGDDGSMTGHPSYLTTREHSAFSRNDGRERFQQPAIVRMCACACACVCNTIVYKYLSSRHYKEKVNRIDGLDMTGRVSLTRHTRHYDEVTRRTHPLGDCCSHRQLPTPAPASLTPAPSHPRATLHCSHEAPGGHGVAAGGGL